MYCNIVYYVLLLYLLSIQVPDIMSLRVALERARAVYNNPKYIKRAKFYLKKFSRNDKYTINLEGELMHTWNNNISIHFSFKEEIRHAVFQPSFIDRDIKYCDFINKEPYIGGMFKKAGCYCPWPPGFHTFNNMTIDTSSIKNLWPFNKARLDFNVFQNENKDDILKAEIFVTFYEK